MELQQNFTHHQEYLHYTAAVPGRINEPFYWTNLDLNFPEEEFTCPDYNSLVSVPKQNCNPIHQSKHNSHLYTLFHLPKYNWVRHPGPSAQNNGLRHVILLAALLQKGLIMNTFDKHFTDFLSIDLRIPMGVRLDIQDLCNFIELKDDSYLTSTSSTNSKTLKNVVMIHNRIKSLEDLNASKQNKATAVDLVNTIDKHTNLTRAKYFYSDSLDDQVDSKKIDSKVGDLELSFFESLSMTTIPDENFASFFEDRGLSGPNSDSVIGISNPEYWIFKDVV